MELLSSKKIQKNENPEKNFHYFGKRNFLTLRLKNFLCFLKRKLFLYFLEKGPPQFPASAPKSLF